MSLRAQPVLSPTTVESIPAEQYRTRSRLGRLYLYSKDTAFTAQENFTTEALALAILEAAEPMLRAIRRMSTVAECPFAFKSVVSLRPRTQVYIPGGGSSTSCSTRLMPTISSWARLGLRSRWARQNPALSSTRTAKKRSVNTPVSGSSRARRDRAAARKAHALAYESGWRPCTGRRTLPRCALSRAMSASNRG